MGANPNILLPGFWRSGAHGIPVPVVWPLLPHVTSHPPLTIAPTIPLPFEYGTRSSATMPPLSLHNVRSIQRTTITELTGPYAPILTGGPFVDAMWRRLLDHVSPLPGAPLPDDPDLHLSGSDRRR